MGREVDETKLILWFQLRWEQIGSVGRSPFVKLFFFNTCKDTSCCKGKGIEVSLIWGVPREKINGPFMNLNHSVGHPASTSPLCFCIFFLMCFLFCRSFGFCCVLFRSALLCSTLFRCVLLCCVLLCLFWSDIWSGLIWSVLFRFVSFFSVVLFWLVFIWLA